MERLSSDQINENIQKLNNWKLVDNAIKKNWKFPDFKGAVKFINQIADLAEQHDHHPDIYNSYNEVSLAFTTHSAGGLTNRDFKIAAEIDEKF